MQGHSPQDRDYKQGNAALTMHAERSISPRYVYGIAAAIILLSAAAMLFRTKAIGLMGWDSYPIIIASRVQSLGDLLGTFTEKFMNGRYSDDFYRPMVNLSFAWDYALWGIKPFGFQLTSVILFACCNASLFALLRRLAGSGACIAPLAMLLFFVFHPAHREIIPIPPRRHEILCCTFMALSLWWQLSPKYLSTSKLSIGPGFLTMVAIASKETGMVLPALSFMAVLLYSPRPTLWRRFLHGIVASICHCLAVGIMIGLRLLVIGRLIGQGEVMAGKNLAAFPKTLFTMLKQLTCPQYNMFLGNLTNWLIAGLTMVLVLGALLLYVRQQRTAKPKTNREPRLIRTAVLALCWMVIIALTYTVSGRSQRLFHQWYLFLPAAGLAMLIGAVVDGLVMALLKRKTLSKIYAVLLLVLFALLFSRQVIFSPMVYHYDEWERATAASNKFLEELHGQIEKAPDGSIVHAPPVPVRVTFQSTTPMTRGVHILSDYSIQAWTDLTFPHRRIRVEKIRPENPSKPAHDEILVLLDKRLEGYY